MPELAQRLRKIFWPFWQSQKNQLEKENEALKGPERPFALLVAEFAKLRYEWASAVIDATKNNDRSRASDAIKLMVRTNAVSARLERLGIRGAHGPRPRALATRALVTKVRQLFTGYHGICVSAPSVFEPPISDSDDKTDGPALRHAAGCRAQQLFMAGDYERLESLMKQSMESLEDLPDGSSRYEGLTGGLTNLFRFGGVAPDVAFGHTADWRRRVRNSEMADLVEAMLLSEWAWSARGTGSANSISAQNLALYAYRSEMAAAALEEVADRASNNPLWYTLSLNVGLDQSKDREQLQAIFDQGFARVPKYRPLYRRMLRILMPRWGGSYEDVDKFINRINAQTGNENDFQRYAELYSDYARMEGDELDLFSDTPAFWSGLRIGYLGLVKRYPRSDVVFNSYANFACRAGDMASYYRLRYAVGQRFSSTAWSPKYSRESCDKKLAASSEFRGPPLPELATGERIQSLGGLRLGMTRNELLSAKGHPILREETYWVYNTIDSKHNGVLTAVFSPSSRDSEGVVRAIEYTGDGMSAPGELPFLNELSSVKVIEMYGPQIDGRLTLSGRMIFRFRNGVYVDTRDEKVFRYGIFEDTDSIPSAH